MADTFRMEGHKEIIEAFRNADPLLKRIGKKHLKNLGDYGVNQFNIHTLNVGASDTMEMLQEFHQTTKATSKGVETVLRTSDKAEEYIWFVEAGTKPHFPPIKALQGWADRHNIPVWAVARKIAREGTEPRWMLRDTYNDVLARADNTAMDIAEEFVREI